MRLAKQGVDVFVVEGGDEDGMDALLKLVKGTKPVPRARARLSP